MQLSRITRFAAIGALGALLGTVTNGAWASSSRISNVDSSKTVAVTGGVSPRALAAADLGVVPDDRHMASMSLRFSLSDAQQAALTQLLADQQNPASPRLHQWLTPAQFGAEFGLSAGDLGKVTAWLTSQGFTVTEVAHSSTFVRFSGTAAQVSAAFQTPLHMVSLNGEQHVANLTAPHLPAAIAAVTLAVTGLDDFRPKAQLSVRQIAPETSLAAPGQPRYTLNGAHYLLPADFYTIYDEKNLLSSSVTGTGVTIAVIGQSDVALSDIANFQALAGLVSTAPTLMVYGGDPGIPTATDEQIAEMGLEWAGAVAPGATIAFVTSQDALDGSMTEAIDNSVGSVLATSYGECEAELGTGPLAFYTQLLAEASSLGISVTAAAGNSGATGCDAGASAVDGLAVDFPASSPYVTAVGGTEFSDGSGTYWSATNGTTGGSALSYIPETAWNDDGSTGLAAGGGGASLYYPKPSWQMGNGVPADFSRDVPDVSLSASIAHDGYVACLVGSCTSTSFTGGSGTLAVAGGTTITAPIFGGLLALVQQKTGGKALGNASPTLYALANSTYSGSVFHDVTKGTNASPCTMGSIGCANGGTIGFAAGTGYDQATGWGSVDAYALVNDYALVKPVAVTTGTIPSFTTLAGSANSVTQGSSIIFTTTAMSATGASTTTPTGSVQLTINGVAAGSALALSSTGTATYTLSTASIPSGTYTMQATYLGDATYEGSKGQFTITVLPTGAPDFALTPSTATVTVASGSVAPALTLTVNALNGFTGSVAFKASALSSVNVQSSFTVNPVVLSSTTSSGSTALSLFAYTAAEHGGTAMAGLSATGGHNRAAGWYKAGSGLAMAGLLLLVIPRRRRLGGVMLAMLLSLGALSSVGCLSSAPGKTSTGTTIDPTPAGTYTVVVTATSTNGTVVSSHSSTITFTVQ